MLSREELMAEQKRLAEEEQLNREGWFRIEYVGKRFITFRAAKGYGGSVWRDGKEQIRDGYVYSAETRKEILSALRNPGM